MNNIRTRFGIKDLENFSGIKAHTIRIWEKRYGLLNPMRSAGNQRCYDLECLLKLLNVKVLYEHGHKISKIGSYTDKERDSLVKNIIISDSDKSSAVDSLKIAMLNFDQPLFEKTYIQLISDFSFRRIFIDVFIPLLEQIGYLWQLDSITPAHEHFVSNLIQQKVLSNIERVQIMQADDADRVFVLYLPMHEIHDLGLLFLHYELTMRGFKSIYLGQSVPLDNLFDLKNIFDKITFVSYMTVFPSSEGLPAYIKRLKTEILDRDDDEVWIVGRKTQEIQSKGLKKALKTFRGIDEILPLLEEVK